MALDRPEFYQPGLGHLLEHTGMPTTQPGHLAETLLPPAKQSQQPHCHRVGVLAGCGGRRPFCQLCSLVLFPRAQALANLTSGSSQEESEEHRPPEPATGLQDLGETHVAVGQNRGWRGWRGWRGAPVHKEISWCSGSGRDACGTQPGRSRDAAG